MDLPASRLGGNDGDYDPDSTVDRSAIQWLRFQTNTNGEALDFDRRGRIYDCSPTSGAVWYYFPSLMVNADTNMVIGFSGSGQDEYIGAFYSWRKANGSTTNQPAVIKLGEGYYELGGRWGDYSHTTLDPDEDGFWTIQEYALSYSGPSGGQIGIWGTRIARIGQWSE